MVPLFSDTLSTTFRVVSGLGAAGAFIVFCAARLQSTSLRHVGGLGERSDSKSVENQCGKLGEKLLEGTTLYIWATPRKIYCLTLAMGGDFWFWPSALVFYPI